MYSYTILVLLENLMCSYKRIMSSPGKLEVFLLHPGEPKMIQEHITIFQEIIPKKRLDGIKAAYGSFVEICCLRDKLCFCPQF